MDVVIIWVEFIVLSLFKRLKKFLWLCGFFWEVDVFLGVGEFCFVCVFGDSFFFVCVNNFFVFFGFFVFMEEVVF